MHHITPRHLGGTDEPENLKRVTVEEHAEEHKKLFELFGYEQDRIAWLALSGIINSEEARCMAVSAACKGVKRGAQTPEHRAKLSEATKLAWSRLGHPKGMKGKKHSEETKIRMREARKVKIVT